VSAATFTAANIKRWRSDPVAFIETLIDPETDAPFVLNDAQRSFVRRAFQLTPDGRLRYPELVFSAPKKSGKTGLAAMLVIYVVIVLGGRFAEGFCVANDLEQAQGRVFTAIKRIVAVSSTLADSATVTQNKIEFRETGATITAIASDFAGAAGANPNIVAFDELWGVTTERGHRLWDEMVPPPTRKIACRLTVTYAGFEGESTLLEDLYKRGMQGEQVEEDLYEQPGMLMFWTHSFTAPWQTETWREQMRKQLRPNGYLRLIENQWVTSESTFVEMEWWDACVDAAAGPLLSDPQMPVWIGVDASTKRDSTAIVAATWDAELKKVRLVTHRVFQPSPTDPLDFEATVEATLLEMVKRFRVKEVRFDPYQMQAVAQRLQGNRVPMVEFPQSSPNITEASTNLYELIKGHNLVVYPDAAMRLSVQRAVAIETPRGWRIAKEKVSHKIDVVVALGMAALGAVQGIGDAPALNKNDDFLVAGAPVMRPLRCDYIFSTMHVDKEGHVGIVFWGRNKFLPGPQLFVLDFDVGFYDASVFSRIAARLIELSSQIRGPVIGITADDVLAAQAEARGYRATAVGRLVRHPSLGTVAAGYVGEGVVKLTQQAFEKAQSNPLASALDFRFGRIDDDPLALACALGVATSLDVQQTLGH
jgi:phage terminase large subunit-like protein